MAISTVYRLGTATVNAGATAVTGAGSLWLAAGLQAGDVFAMQGLSVGIASINGDGSLTLTDPWPGASASSAAYEIRLTPDATRVLTSAREALRRMAEGDLIDLESVTLATGAPGSAATYADGVLTLPRGKNGAVDFGDLTIATGAAGSSVTYNPTTETLTIPRGADGDVTVAAVEAMSNRGDILYLNTVTSSPAPTAQASSYTVDASQAHITRSNGCVVELYWTTTNTDADPVATISGTTYTIKGRNGAALSAGDLTGGNRYLGVIHGGTQIRLFGAVGISDINGLALALAALGNTDTAITAAMNAMSDRGDILQLTASGTPTAQASDFTTSATQAHITRSNGQAVQFFWTTTNTGPDPTATIAGTTYTIKGRNGAALSAGDLTGGNRYLGVIHGGTQIRLFGAVGISDINGLALALAAEASARASNFSVAGTVRLSNVGGTADAITADLPAEASGLSITNGSYVLLRPTVTNTSATPTLSIGGGAARTLQNENGNTLGAGRLIPNVFYLIYLASNGAAQVRGIFAPPSYISEVPNIQADIAALETQRTPIPMVSTQAAYGGAFTVTAVSELWPTNSYYDYEFTVPAGGGKPVGTSLVVTQYGNTRTISGASAIELQPGDRVVYHPTSNGAGYLVRIAFSAERLTAMQAAIAGAPMIVQQVDGTMPDRPNTSGIVLWSVFDDPGAKKKKRDIVLDKIAATAPSAPDASAFYIRPTLGSPKTEVVIRGIDLSDQLPILTGFRYAVDGGSPVTLPATSPHVAEISGLTPDVAAFIQIAMTNYIGAGTFSPVKNFTPVSSATFNHPLAEAVSASAVGTRGFKNVKRKESNGNDHGLSLTSNGVWTAAPNRQGWMQSDVGGLSGDNLFAEMQIYAGASAASYTTALGLGLNNTWTADANANETVSGCLGLMLRVTATTWQLVNRTGAESQTVLQSGALGAVPTSMRIERQGMTVRGYVSGVLVVTYDATAIASVINAAEGIGIFAYRPSGTVAEFKGRNLVAGKLA